MLADIRESWNAAAQRDPFYSILTIPNLTREEFWEMGRAEAFDVVREVGEPLDRALDFGCGVGRITRGLADFYEQVDGVDISPEMIRLAKSHDERPTYQVLKGVKLPFDDATFDVVYTNITLQHMPPNLAGRYVREFLRVSRGHVIFQVADGPTGTALFPPMYGVTKEQVYDWLDGAEVVNLTENDAAGRGYRSYRFTVKA